MNIQVLFYSIYGHVYHLAEAVAEGALEVKGVEIEFYRVPELLPETALDQSRVQAAHELFGHVPLASLNRLAEADAIILGTPALGRAISPQIRSFLAEMEPLGRRGVFIDKVAGAFVAATTDPTDQQSALCGLYTALLEMGAVVVSAPVSPASQVVQQLDGDPRNEARRDVDEPDDVPTDQELIMARIQGHHVATVTQQIMRGWQASQGKTIEVGGSSR